MKKLITAVMVAFLCTTNSYSQNDDIDAMFDDGGLSNFTKSIKLDVGGLFINRYAIGGEMELLDKLWFEGSLGVLKSDSTSNIQRSYSNSTAFNNSYSPTFSLKAKYYLFNHFAFMFFAETDSGYPAGMYVSAGYRYRMHRLWPKFEDEFITLRCNDLFVDFGFEYILGNRVILDIGPTFYFPMRKVTDPSITNTNSSQTSSSSYKYWNETTVVAGLNFKLGIAF